MVTIRVRAEDNRSGIHYTAPSPCSFKVWWDSSTSASRSNVSIWVAPFCRKPRYSILPSAPGSANRSVQGLRIPLLLRVPDNAPVPLYAQQDPGQRPSSLLFLFRPRTGALPDWLPDRRSSGRLPPQGRISFSEMKLTSIEAKSSSSGICSWVR